MKINLANFIIKNSEKESLLEQEILLSGSAIISFYTLYALKRGFFLSYLKGVSFYNIPFKVRGRPKSSSLMPGNIYSQVYPLVSLYFTSTQWEYDLHPFLRPLKEIEVHQFSNLIEMLGDLVFIQKNFKENLVTRTNILWITITTGYYIDAFFRSNKYFSTKSII